jgi:hypothetical protein
VGPHVPPVHRLPSPVGDISWGGGIFFFNENFFGVIYDVNILVNDFQSQRFKKSMLSKVNVFKSQRFQKSTLSKVNVFKSQCFQKSML